MRKLIPIVLAISVIAPFATKAQDVREANFQFKQDNYPTALKLYLPAYKKDTGNVDIAYAIGICKIRTNAAPRGIEVVVGKVSEIQLDATFFGAILQYPNQWGEINDYTQFIADAKAKGIFVGMSADLMALALLKAPGELGADCVFVAVIMNGEDEVVKAVVLQSKSSLRSRRI